MNKLSGMTGTATTEKDEFATIYKLDIIEIPTNKPMARIDNPDVVYKTEAGKYRAVVRQAKECHEKGQPVLVGTVSIEKNELLSGMLKREGIPHNVLNAKYHEKEAEIVAQAGKIGAVTVATNMAGRGTDIMLGGNPEYLAKNELRKAGYSDELIIKKPPATPIRTTRRSSPPASSLRRPTTSSKPRSPRRRKKCVKPAACSSWAPSGMNPAGSTTSCAAVPAGRATPAPPASICRWRTI